MPYIKNEKRALVHKELEALFEKIKDNDELNAGMLNYIITMLVTSVFYKNMSYDTANMICGVLTCAKDEFYRMHVAKYEESKMKENSLITWLQ